MDRLSFPDRMMRLVVILVMLGPILAACGGGSDSDDDPTTVPTQTTTQQSPPTVVTTSTTIASPAASPAARSQTAAASPVLASPSVATPAPATATMIPPTDVPPTATATATVQPTSTPTATGTAAPVASRPDEPECQIATPIECIDQTVRIALPLIATDEQLSYASDRVPGRANGQVWDARVLGLGGWSLDILHAYDPLAKIIYFGNGRWRSVQPVGAPPGSNPGDLAIADESGRELYLFDRFGRHRQTMDTLTGAVSYRFLYDGDWVTAIVDQSDNQLTIERRNNGQPTAIVSPLGQRLQLGIDGNGFVNRITYPGGEIVELMSTAEGLLTRTVDPRGSSVSFTYGSDGRLTQVIDADGRTVALARTATADGFDIAVTLNSGRVTTYSVTGISTDLLTRSRLDSDGTRVEATIGNDGTRSLRAPDGTTVSVRLAPDPRWGMQSPVLAEMTEQRPSGLTTVTTATREVTLADQGNLLSLQSQIETETVDGRTSTFIYDASARTMTERDPLGRELVTTLDTHGRLVKWHATGEMPVSYSYDTLGRLTQITEGTGDDARAMTISFADDDGTVTLTDPLGRTQRLTYDVSERVLQETLPGNRTVGYGYDDGGQLNAIAPPGRPAYTYRFTEGGFPATSITPGDNASGSSLTAMTYGPDGELTTFALADGRTVTLDYDAAGRIAALNLARGQMTVSYDQATGELIGLADPNGIELSLAYDGDLLAEQSWSGEIAGTVGVTFDSGLRLATLTVNDESPITFAYDAADQVIAAGDLTVERSPETDWVAAATLGSVHSSWTYDSYGSASHMRTAFGQSSLLDFTFTRDAIGRVTERKETIDGQTVTVSYSYDDAGRLIEVQSDGATIATYTYDINGNRLSSSGPNGQTTAAFDSADRLVQSGGATFEYSDDGQLVSRTEGGQTTTFAYDEIGNLLTVTHPDGTKIDYLVDAMGRRVGTKVNGSLTKGFLYQDDLRPAAELDASGAVISRFVYASDDNVPLALVRDGVNYRILTDPVGSVRMVVNAETGEIVQRIDYDPFGVVLSDTNPGFQPFGFAGGLYDPQTGLTHFGARDYDATTGRWTGADPLGFASGDTNFYAYAGNDPVNNIDPTGEAIPLLIIGGWMLVNGGIEYAIQYQEHGGDTSTFTTGTWAAIGGQTLLGAVGGVLNGPRAVSSLWKLLRLKKYKYGLKNLFSETRKYDTVRKQAWGASPGVARGKGRCIDQHHWLVPRRFRETGRGKNQVVKEATTPKLRFVNAGLNLLYLPCWINQDIGALGEWAIRGLVLLIAGNSGLLGGRLAYSFGDPHLRSPDGLGYDFQGVGEYIAAESDDGALVIQMRLIPWFDSDRVSTVGAVAMNVAGDRVGLYAGRDQVLWVNGQPIDIGDGTYPLPSGGRIERHGQQFFVVWPDGSAAEIQLRGADFLNLIFGTAKAHEGHLAGLFGNNDGDPGNDLVTRDGTPITLSGLPESEYLQVLYREYGESWRISQDESLFDYAPGEDTTTFTRTDLPADLARVSDLDTTTRQAAEQSCRDAGVTDQPFLDACILDVGLTGEVAFANSAARIETVARPNRGLRCTNLVGGGARCSHEPRVPVNAVAGTTYLLEIETIAKDRRGFETFTCGPITADLRASCGFLTKGSVFQDGAYRLTFTLADGSTEQPSSTVKCDSPKRSGETC